MLFHGPVHGPLALGTGCGHTPGCSPSCDTHSLVWNFGSPQLFQLAHLSHNLRKSAEGMLPL